MNEKFEEWKNKNLYINELGEVCAKGVRMGKLRTAPVSIETFEDCFKAGLEAAFPAMTGCECFTVNGTYQFICDKCNSLETGI